MSAHPASAASVPAAPRAGIRLPGVGVGLGRGTVVLYLSLDRPAAAGGASPAKPFEGGLGTFWDQVTPPQAVARSS